MLAEKQTLKQVDTLFYLFFFGCLSAVGSISKMAQQWKGYMILHEAAS